MAPSVRKAPLAKDRESAGVGAGRLTSVGWLPDADLQYPNWAAAGRRLGGIARCSQWWLGDWVRYGTWKYGEKYVHASKLTGYDVQSLRNMSYVASKFSDISRRRDRLSWSHHAEVAALPPVQQDRWLVRAEEERLSVSDLRAELRTERRKWADVGQAASDDPDRDRADNEDLCTCPECGHQWSRSARRRLEATGAISASIE